MVMRKGTPIFEATSGKLSVRDDGYFSHENNFLRIGITLETYMKFCNEQTIVFQTKEKRQEINNEN